MNYFYFNTFVLAHGIDMNRRGGVFLIIVMSLFVFCSLMFRKYLKMPRGLWGSFVVPYIIVTISILDFSFDLFAPTSIVVKICSIAVFYPGFIFSNAGFLFFVAAFIIDTLIIFGLIRLISFIKHKILPKTSKQQADQSS